MEYARYWGRGSLLWEYARHWEGNWEGIIAVLVCQVLVEGVQIQSLMAKRLELYSQYVEFLNSSKAREIFPFIPDLFRQGSKISLLQSEEKTRQLLELLCIAMERSKPWLEEGGQHLPWWENSTSTGHPLWYFLWFLFFVLIAPGEEGGQHLPLPNKQHSGQRRRRRRKEDSTWDPWWAQHQGRKEDSSTSPVSNPTSACQHPVQGC